VHSASTGKYSLIIVHDRRGRDAMNAAGVLPTFAGVAVHDAWAPYDTYPQLSHALCNAHALRELAAVTELAADSDTAGQWCWATQVAESLRELNILVNHTEIPDADAVAEQVRRYYDGVVIGAHTTRAPSTKLERKHHAPARRLRDRQGDYLPFVTDDRFRQQRRRARDPDDQAVLEGVRLPVNPHRRRTFLRHPQLPRHRLETRHQLLRRPGHIGRGSRLDARSSMNSGFRPS